jgi:imidazolonepropionase-like amidohydrolase
MYNDAALYLSASRDGTLLYVSEGGLRVRKTDGGEVKVGWPLNYTMPVPESIVLRNVRVFDAARRSFTATSDILIEKGRIAKIEKPGRIASPQAKVIDGAQRFVIPGLFDLHAHVYRPDLLPAWPYFGVTTIRDQGSSIGPLAAYASNIASGALPGPRIAYGGFQYYSDWAFDEDQGRGIEPEADPAHIKRAVDLSEAFGAQHIKTRTFRRWDINARMITEAHRRGMRATGHCSHLLPLIAAGMDAKEHIGICQDRGNTHMYDDMVQLFKAARVDVVPTVTYLDYAVRLSEKPSILDEDSELAPFMPSKDNFGWMLRMSKAVRDDWANDIKNTREGLAKLFRAGVTIGVGTDIWQIPTGVHMELEQLVSAGLTPAEALIAGTRSSAQILGAEKDLGTIEVGKRADLVIIDADPLVDIRNTRKIWNVFKDGHLIDRNALLRHMKPR